MCIYLSLSYDYLANLRLSANQNQKLVQELNDYKNKIAANDQESNLLRQKMSKLISENKNLDD